MTNKYHLESWSQRPTVLRFDFYLYLFVTCQLRPAQTLTISGFIMIALKASSPWIAVKGS